MRLLTRIRREEEKRAAESAATEAARRELTPVGVIWIDDESNIDVSTLQPGDEIVRDFIVEPIRDGATIARSRERIASGPDDVGLILDEAGNRIGHVASDDGKIIKLSYDDAGGAKGAA